MKHFLVLGGLLIAVWPGVTAQGFEGGSPNQIAQEVRHQIVTLPGYRVFDYLAYRIDGSKVTIRGQVTTPLLKSAAEKAVKSIEGVTSVDNEIEVLGLSRWTTASGLPFTKLSIRERRCKSIRWTPCRRSTLSSRTAM